MKNRQHASCVLRLPINGGEIPCDAGLQSAVKCKPALNLLPGDFAVHLPQSVIVIFLLLRYVDSKIRRIVKIMLTSLHSGTRPAIVRYG
jgi:hypothetical protein